MDYYAAAAVIPNLLASAITALVAYKVWTGNRTAHRKAMALSFLFVSLSSLMLLAEKLISDVALARAVVVAEYICDSMILITLLVFVMQYIGLERFVTRRNILLVSSPAVLIVLLNATDPLHHLFYEDVVIIQSHGFYMFDAQYGPLFLMWIVYYLSAIVLVNLLMAKAILDTPSERRAGLAALMMATSAVLFTSLIYIATPRDDPFLDVMSIGFTLAALIIYAGERLSEFTGLEIIRFREAIGGMEEAIIILDPSLKVVYANPSGRKVLDQNKEYLWERMAARGLKVPAGSNNWETAMEIDGETRHFILSTSDIFREGKPIGVVLVFHDITDRKVLEEGLRSTNRSLSTLNQILRHDIRNDLTAIWGYLELIEASDLDERQRGLLGKTIDRVKSADGHLEFARRQGAPGATAIWQDVQASMENALGKVDLRGVKVESRVQGIRVLADPLLENVFHTLADNTMRHGGAVSRMIVRGENIETGLALIWEDDGIGVPPEQKGLVFDKGYGDNTGLGLYLAREILSNTGITITEEGEPGKGARFVMRVPSGWFTWKMAARP